jgi:hypothetical protein
LKFYIFKAPAHSTTGQMLSLVVYTWIITFKLAISQSE